MSETPEELKVRLLLAVEDPEPLALARGYPRLVLKIQEIYQLARIADALKERNELEGFRWEREKQHP